MSAPGSLPPTRRQVYKLLTPNKDFDGEVGVWMAAIDDVRSQTLEAAKGLRPEELAWRPPHGGNSIGQLLRHIALVELDWIITDLCGETELPASAPAILRIDGAMADPGAHGLPTFVEALEYARATTRDRLQLLTAADLDSKRTYKGEGVNKVFTVRWILFHLVDHESQHKGQILAVRRMLENSLK